MNRAHFLTNANGAAGLAVAAVVFNHLSPNFIPMVIDLEKSSVRAVSSVRS